MTKKCLKRYWPAYRVRRNLMPIPCQGQDAWRFDWFITETLDLICQGRDEDDKTWEDYGLKRKKRDPWWQLWDEEGGD
jgi:hypothetical protein